VHLGEGPINFISIASYPGAEGDCFVACYSGRVVRVTSRGEVRARLPVHEGAVKSVRLHPERELGVSCSADGKLRSWTFDGRIVDRYLGHSAIVNDVDIDPAGRRLASVSRDFTLKIYEVDGGRLLESLALGWRSLKSVCFVTEDVVLVGDYWGGLFRVDLKTGVSTREEIAQNGVSSLARCGGLVLATSYDGSVSALHPSKRGLAHRLVAMKQRLDLGTRAEETL
jgi:WD40 repeat protein